MEEKQEVSKNCDNFENAEMSITTIEKELESLKKTIYWLIYREISDAKVMHKYLNTIRSEINYKYYAKHKVSFAIGDIVTCNYGMHAKCEICGAYVHAIVCDIQENGLVYLLPIVKKRLAEDKMRFMPFTKDEDIIYIDQSMEAGTILLNRGGYLSDSRISSVIGYCDPEFFKKVLEVFPKTLDFYHNA